MDAELRQGDRLPGHCAEHMVACGMVLRGVARALLSGGKQYCPKLSPRQLCWLAMSPLMCSRIPRHEATAKIDALICTVPWE